MKKIITIIAITFALTLASHAVTFAEYVGVWTEGTNSGVAIVSIGSGTWGPGAGVATISRQIPGGWLNENALWTDKGAVRLVTQQNTTNSFSLKIINGLVRGTFLNFVTGAKGTITCDVPR